MSGLISPGQVAADQGEQIVFDKERQPLRVLILEDVPSDAELVQVELRRAQIPFVARCVETRDAFLLCMEEFPPEIILSDFSMPGFDALEALDLLRQVGSDVPFILVTGSQSEEVAVQCMRNGADDYILKATLKRLPSALLNAVKKKETERDRAHALQALRDSEEHFRSLIENALDIILVLNPDATIRYASSSMRALGYVAEELVGLSFFELVSSDDIRGVGEVFNAAFRMPGLPQKAEFLCRHRDGSFRVLETIGKAIDPDKRAAAIVLNARDITDRKQAEAAIEKLAAFPRLNPNPVFELNALGELTYFNRAASDLARLAGKSPAEILPEDIVPVAKEVLRTGQSTLRRETSLLNRIIAWSFFPIIPSQSVHCYALDITERLNLEAQLRQAQKLESIGQLAAGVAHDFNNILTIVSGYSNMLLERTDLPKDVRDPVKQVAVAAERATNLTRQLLMFSRKQVMQLQELDLNETISGVTKFLRRILGEDITLHFNYSPNLPKIQADSGMIEQIILNLAVNARDAMPRGGSLSIGTHAVEINPIHTRANSEARAGQFVCLRVSDRGTGIPPDVLPRIFEPFFTTKQVGKGTGLGLATVYGIAKQHEGWIEVLTEPGKGTTFRVFLPAVAATAQLQEPPPKEDLNCRGSETVLVVEDEPELRAMVCAVLKTHGYDVLEAGSGPEALSLWQQHASRIDLLLTDMVMPGNMTGRELAGKLERDKAGLKVVYTSGYSVEMFADDFVLKRGLNYLQKPYHPVTLAKVIRECLDC